MDPFILDIVKSTLRIALVPLFVWLVDQGIIPADKSEAYLAGLIGVLITVGWSLYDKYWKRKTFVAALALPSGASPAEAKIAAQSGNAPPVTLKEHEKTRPMRIPTSNTREP